MRKRSASRRRGRPSIITVPLDGARIVKKYGNRRLYDVQDSRYVNLEELMDLFIAEEELKVLDANSGEDLTEKTLAQALLLERKEPLFSPELLRALVRYRRSAKRADFDRYLARAVASFRREHK
jgi:polyhydroxyalkanoate synthesis repressor PhaR